MTPALLSLDDISVTVPNPPGAQAVAGVDIEIMPGEAVAVVGESGCGKTVTAYSTLGLLAPGLTASGRLTFGGRSFDLSDTAALRNLRGREIAMIFQDPLTCLNPLMPVGRQMADVLRANTDLDRRARARRVVDLLARVGIPAPARVARAYPFELSGGMRQRVLIAMAVGCQPRLLIADEPTTALDTTVQAQIMELLRDLVREQDMAMLFISHDLGLVAEFCERVYVMYAGRVVESGPVEQVLSRPTHPYTRALVECLVTMGAGSRRLATVPGSVPSIDAMPVGCRFEPRCRFAVSACEQSDPPIRDVPGRGRAACLRAEELPAPSGMAGVRPAGDA
ncbi:ABC transporter ATP-binding protein [Phytoactinopolyspora alkaliphila]|uniref:ABC transporter ATP-binding protein n=1 Tax=Phytoactinopolyspora alkaliphila TaxID=1783498 RepID=A0A6N9YMZ8_9ACTN|nr:ABC transporter ATP-binding protein [Phytoactinopolyspora alkaliphila]NED96290.1 ABC transporter ATP-binding protein [Phytoactinopolyspora alkaliphila]